MYPDCLDVSVIETIHLTKTFTLLQFEKHRISDMYTV